MNFLSKGHLFCLPYPNKTEKTWNKNSQLILEFFKEKIQLQNIILHKPSPDHFTILLYHSKTTVNIFAMLHSSQTQEILKSFQSRSFSRLQGH